MLSPSKSEAIQSLNFQNPSARVFFHHASVTRPVPTIAAPIPHTVPAIAGTIESGVDSQESTGVAGIFATLLLADSADLLSSGISVT